jgi:DNA-binding protein YbaB
MEDDGGRLESLLAAYYEMRRKLAETNAPAASTGAVAESPDGLARATVGTRGELLDLLIRPEVYRGADPGTLAATITSTVAEARQQFDEERPLSSTDSSRCGNTS